MPSLNTKLASAPNTTANYVLKATTSTTIGNSLIFDNGNIGINTSTPSSFSGYTNFTLKGGGFGSNLDFHNASNTRIASIVSTSGTDFKFEVLEAVPLIFNVNSAERMRITSAGVVDIPNRNLSRGSMPVGSVIQTVTYQLVASFSTTSSSDQDTGLKVSITPTSSTSKILVLVSANVRATTGSGNCYVTCKLIRGAFNTGTTLHNGFAVMGNFNSTDIRGSVSYAYLDSPATTSSTQYVIAMNSQFAGTVFLDSTTSPSTITLLEIAQ